MINRRESLRVLAGAVGAWTLGGVLPGRPETTVSPRTALAPEQEEGPFYIPAEHIRRDIREGRPGVPLDLRITLVDAHSGQPLTGAAVDIWHCDASGVYSGFAAMKGGAPPGGGSRFGGFPSGPPPGPPPDFHDHAGGPPHHAPTDARRFLRGVQVTDNNGLARFNTIYPGWYMGREIHVHLKVHNGGAAADGTYAAGHISHTGQIFFPDAANAAVSKLRPYVSSQIPRTTKETDGVYRHQNGDRTIAAVRTARVDSTPGYLAAITLAVDSAASPKPVGFR
jgi:protocatechuate 3,4-dioxygenase beta subunit